MEFMKVNRIMRLSAQTLGKRREFDKVLLANARKSTNLKQAQGDETCEEHICDCDRSGYGIARRSTETHTRLGVCETAVVCSRAESKVELVRTWDFCWE